MISLHKELCNSNNNGGYNSACSAPFVRSFLVTREEQRSPDGYGTFITPAHYKLCMAWIGWMDDDGSIS